MTQNFTQRLRKKLAEHFSIMMIPHDEKRLFSFQISNTVILFFAGVVVLLAGSIYYYRTIQNELHSNIQKVSAEDQLLRRQRARYKKVIKEHKKAYELYQNRISGFLDLLNGTPDFSVKKDEISQNEVISKLSDKYHLSPAEIPEEIPNLMILSKSLKNSKKQMKEIEKILSTRKVLLNDIPTQWPLKGHIGYKTSPFGMRYSPFLGKKTFHTGVDIAAPPRTVVKAAADGKVIFAGIKTGYGNTIMIEHKYGFRTLYGHNMYLIAAKGQQVKKGDSIALVGKSGRATGYHVHFELRIFNRPVDPWPYITTKF